MARVPNEWKTVVTCLPFSGDIGDPVNHRSASLTCDWQGYGASDCQLVGKSFADKPATLF